MAIECVKEKRKEVKKKDKKLIKAVHDLVDPARRDADGHGESVLGDSHRLKELLQQDLPRVDRRDPRHGWLPTSRQW